MRSVTCSRLPEYLVLWRAITAKLKSRCLVGSKKKLRVKPSKMLASQLLQARISEQVAERQLLRAHGGLTKESSNKSSTPKADRTTRHGMRTAPVRGTGRHPPLAVKFTHNKMLAGTQALSLDLPWHVCLLCKPRLAAQHLPYCSGCHMVSCVVLYPLSTKLVVMQPFSASLRLIDAPLF